MPTGWYLLVIGLCVVSLIEGVMLLLLYRQIGLFYLGTASGVSRDGLDLGTQAPVVATTDINGEKMALGSPQDTWTLVVFGSDQCPACRNLVPTLNMLSDQTELNLVYLCSGNEQAARAFARETGLRIRTVPVVSSKIFEAYRVRVTPFSMVLDPSGTVRGKGLVNDLDHVQIILNKANVPDKLRNIRVGA